MGILTAQVSSGLQSAGQQLHCYRYYLLSWAGTGPLRVKGPAIAAPIREDHVAFSATDWECSEVSASQGSGD